jgi:hypothetical protein
MVYSLLGIATQQEQRHLYWFAPLFAQSHADEAKQNVNKCRALSLFSTL